MLDKAAEIAGFFSISGFTPKYMIVITWYKMEQNKSPATPSQVCKIKSNVNTNKWLNIRQKQHFFTQGPQCQSMSDISIHMYSLRHKLFYVLYHQLLFAACHLLVGSDKVLLNIYYIRSFRLYILLIVLNPCYFVTIKLSSKLFDHYFILLSIFFSLLYTRTI